MHLCNCAHILYGVELYANTYAVHLDKLTKLNNKILRILQNKPVLTPTSELYTAYNTLPIVELHRQQILILAQKSLLHSDRLNYLMSLVTIFAYTRIYMNIIQDKKIVYTSLAPSCNLSFGQRCIRNKAGAEWNELPLYLKSFMSIREFKYKTHYYLMSLL